MSASQEAAADGQREMLEAFDRGYEEFTDTFAQVPDEALSYLPPGDEYALGTLPIHLTHPIARYLALLERLVTSDFAPTDVSADAQLARQQEQWHAMLVAMRPRPAERPHHLAELEAAHHTARARLAALDAAAFERAGPVMYSAGSDPYPTSAHAIAQWLTDHYREHTAQTLDLVARWRSAPSSPPSEAGS
jgi:hypothetical protein